ncbi:MAG: hypothetical protein KDB24_06485, partial [Microthrixaceae bacterium]|nr:hypothetical protein [Microthrixaceae bacterium]
AIVTELGRHLTDELIEQMMARTQERTPERGEVAPGDSGGLRFKSVEAGAATQVWASVADLAEHNGAYLADCQVGVSGGDLNTTGYLSYLLDDDHVERLWTLSEELVDRRFPER